MSEYEKQANDFLEKTGTTFKAELIGHFPYFEGDKESRDVYQITLTRKDKVYSFRFGQSIVNSGPASIPDSSLSFKEIDKLKRQGYIHHCSLGNLHRAKLIPTPYDVLAGVQKHDVGTFADFCSEYGYDADSSKAEKIYFAVQDEYSNIQRMFFDVMEALQEIS